MHNETKKSNERSSKKSVGEPANLIQIEHLIDLEPHTDDIIDRFNADKRIALLAVADPVGVLREFGYGLSPQAARDLQRKLPRLSRDGRDRYLTWLRDLDPIPDTVGIKLVKRPSGRELLKEPAQSQSLPVNPGPKVQKGAAGLDVVIQFGEAFCERVLQRHYSDGRLPRSVYRIGKKLHYFMHSGHYEDFKKYIGNADREIHFGKPSLEFLTNKPNHVRMSSIFVTSGFNPKSINGSVTVDAKLALMKDKQGHPQYIEATFDGLTNADVIVSIYTTAPSAAVQTELKKMLYDAYKDFCKLSMPNKPHVSLTFTLVNSNELASKGVKPNPGEAKFSVIKPIGSSSPILVVGFNRAEQKGSGQLSTVSNYIKPGGDLAVVQDAGWLEQAANTGFAKALPIRFDPNSGQPSNNGDLRVDSIVWHYRKEGMTGDISAVYENYFLWVNKKISGQAHIDIIFHSSDPTIEIVGYSDLKGMECWEKFLLVLLMTLIGAVAGGIAGAIVGGVLGGAAVGALIGVYAGMFGGFLGGLYLIGWLPMKFDTGGVPPKAQQGMKQTLKVTHDQTLPEIIGTVKVIPNDIKISNLGTAMSAKIVGPSYNAVEPWVRISGSHSVDITLPKPAATSTSAQSGEIEGTEASVVITSKGQLDNFTGSGSGWTLGQAGAGTISLHYYLASTYGLQGTLSYLWTFNGKPIGSSKKVDVDVSIDANVLAWLQYNKVNHLGVLKLTVKDALGQSAYDTVKVMIGNQKDFRPRVAPGIFKVPWVVDPLERMKWKWHNEFISHVGWAQEGTNLVQPEGILVAYTTFELPFSGETFIVLGTATMPEAMM